MLQFILNQSFIFPGEPLRFAWRLLVLEHLYVPLRSADLELVRVEGADEEHLWDRTGIEWPPPSVGPEDTDGIWPPIGWVAEAYNLLGGARSLLYSGLETKTIRLKVTVRDNSGSQQMYSADNRLTVVLPPNALTASLTSPSSSSWGASYTLRGSFTNSSYAEMSGFSSVTGDDHPLSADIPIRVDAHSAQERNLAGPTVQNWQWNDHPTYHVREDRLTNRIMYGLTLTGVEDEFHNHYPDVSGLPFSVTV